jgi:hypothetical protein
MNATCVKVQIEDNEEPLCFRVQYRVDREKTEITFPNGIQKEFPTWDVKGVRQAFFKSEYLIPPDEYLRNNGRTLTNYGITPGNVADFIADLARKPQYEYLFLPKGAK